MSCCDTNEQDKGSHSGHEHEDCHSHETSFDWVLYGSLFFIACTALLRFFAPDFFQAEELFHSITALLKKMWWGILFGCLAVGLMHNIPRAYFQSIIGRSNTFSGLIRAVLAGVLLDLCSHGILMVGAKLYERGVSLAQVMTFLIASPWNSFSLTLILVSLIGLKWTLTFIALSAAISITTGLLFMLFVNKGVLPKNPHSIENPPDFKFWSQARKDLKGFRPNLPFLINLFKSSATESRMLLRWLLLGTILAGLLQVYVPTDVFAQYFGPTILGLMITLAAATVVEVCSEGMAPIGADILNRASAPGNGFSFLMAGVATDYTEIMIIREFTKKWKIALFLPLLTIPQILIVGYLLNTASF